VQQISNPESAQLSVVGQLEAMTELIEKQNFSCSYAAAQSPV